MRAREREQREGYDIDALELIASRAYVVLGCGEPQLREIDSFTLHGEIDNVVPVADGRIARVATTRTGLRRWPPPALVCD